SAHHRPRDLLEAVQDVPALGPQLYPRGVALRQDRLVAAAAIAIPRDLRKHDHEPALPGRLRVDRAVGDQRAEGPRLDLAHATRDHGGVAGVRALLPEERALLGFRVRNPVRVLLLLCAHLDLPLRGAHPARARLADSLKRAEKKSGRLGRPW